MIWISVKLYLIKKESAMKNQLKKIIHCVLITLILQSQVLSVQAAQVKFDENKKFSAVWRNNVYMITYDPNAGVCDLVVNGGNANVRWDSIPDVQTSYYYVYYK